MLALGALSKYLENACDDSVNKNGQSRFIPERITSLCA
jgi:hypothetical protein